MLQLKMFTFVLIYLLDNVENLYLSKLTNHSKQAILNSGRLHKTEAYWIWLKLKPIHFLNFALENVFSVE